MTKRQYLYAHEVTGDIVRATKQSAKKLPKQYKQIEFTTNDQGKKVMRMHLEGATVDISENEQVENPIIEGEVVENGDTTTN